ncbi:hypothetical protein EII25_00995 [Erysipelotrichaceae bacterium OH741_COT-311]|nr:hypothetical protein [Erysipelotrichaceae bacterium]MDO5084893.1 hypothetical protein [Erysipelotrichaceae bacterium]RRC94087.1 hypothetical protein EII25_00995 [Erysipelotrichaceae bacterium OH741_COT-311]
MKKLVLFFILAIFIVCSGFTLKTEEEYVKEFESSQVDMCSTSSTKSYMSYKSITSRGSRQYKYIQEYMTVDEETGLLYDEDGFIGVALGSAFGSIGTRYYFTLDTGKILPVVKVEEKSDNDTEGGCYHLSDNSVIELVIDREIAIEYFGLGKNGLILSGNFNNYEGFKGAIKKIELVSDQKIDNSIFYEVYTAEDF